MIKNIVLPLAFVLTLNACTSRPVVIACVGDSITEGARHKKQSETAYPKVLGDLLGEDYAVVNCGKSGTTALKVSNAPYWNCKEFSNVFAVRPDIITIKLGTNDSKPQNWNAEEFKKSYQSLIDTFLTIKPKPKIYLCVPVPVFEDSRFKIDAQVVEQEIIPIVKSMAKENNLPIIDLYQPLLGKAYLAPDGVHPEEEGAALIAEIITNKIKRK